MQLLIYLRKFYNKIILFFAKIVGIFNKNIKGVTCINNLYYNNNKCKQNTLNVVYKNTKATTIICYIHAGGWIEYDKLIYNTLCKRFANNLNCVVLNINYRLGPKYNICQQLNDVVSAINFGYSYCINNNIAVNNANFILAGDSAGAWFSSYIACNVCGKQNLLPANFVINNKNLKALFLFYGVYDFTTLKATKFKNINLYMYGAFGKRYNEFALLKNYSCIDKVDNNFVPTLIASGKIDKLHTLQSEAFYNVLQANNIKTCKLFFNKKQKLASHGFMAFDDNLCCKVVLNKTKKFYNEVLNNSDNN